MTRELVRRVHHSAVAKKQGSSPNTSESAHIVPNGYTLRLDRFSGGSEYSATEVRTELIWRDGSDTVIAVGYGSSYQFSIEMDFQGNGTASIVMKHYNGDSSELNMASWWEGMEYSE